MRVAIVQVCSDDDLAGNLARAERGVAEAAECGAKFVALPENFAYMRREGGKFPCAQGPDGEIVAALRGWASRYGVWLLGGTFPEAIEGDERVYNTSIVCSPEGLEIARYRKMHLFDVALGDNTHKTHKTENTDDTENTSGVYRESTHFAPGNELVLAKTPFGGLGLSVCYDLRFPEFYRALTLQGARWLAVPSAFTRETGKDHWEVLLRARAIENQAYVIAPAQCGHHSADRSSHGRSMIIDPWGLVLAQGGDAPTVLVADCPTAEIDRVRKAIPALKHRRLPNQAD